jgi:aryl-alcohol dehydrogenase-like predicted oxidoreductase
MTPVRLTDFTTLGRSGLSVSPVCLGTMTFGAAPGFGADLKTSRALLERYVELGGNFVDTADTYSGGQSEEIIGDFLGTGQLRDRLVIATKCSFNAQRGNPNAGGNGRKNIVRAVEGSLRRLKTDYIDLYYLHVWDTVTPPEEVIATLSDLVRGGKVRYYGLSDCPAWYVARAATVAEFQGLNRVVTLQHEYSLIERSIEREHIPAAQELGLGLCIWAPLGGGLLTGKYRREGAAPAGDGRLVNTPQVRNRFTERNWRILEELSRIARILDRPLGHLAMRWAMQRPGVTSTILGATSVQQLDTNLQALESSLPQELCEGLNEVSALEPSHPYVFFSEKLQRMISGETSISAWQRAYGLRHGNP